MEKKRQFFQKRHSIFKRMLSGMLVLAMVLTMDAFPQLGKIVAEAAGDDTEVADGGVESPIIVKNSDGTYNVTLQYQGEGGNKPTSVGVRGTIPGTNWDSDVAMTKGDNDIWSTEFKNLQAPTDGDSYGYKFLLNGDGNTESNWILDPKNTLKTWDNNSALILNEKPVITEKENGKYDITFKYADITNEVTSVEVMGELPGASWNIGSSINMNKTAKGSNIWYVTINDVEKGSYKYKFVLNGDASKPNEGWINDPSNEKLDSDNANSQIDVPDGVDDGGADDGKVTLKIYYHRSDNTYTNWDLWMWDEDGTNSISGNPPFQFKIEKDESGSEVAVATVNIAPGGARLGYIVRRGEWEEKDVEDNQFIDLLGVVSGTVSLHIESGVKNEKCEYAGDVVTVPMIRSAVYNESDSTITVGMTGKIEDGNLKDVFAVSSGAEVDSVEAGADNVYVIHLKEALDLLKSYSISYTGNKDYADKKYAVQLPTSAFYASDEFKQKYTYDGDDLGATWTKDKTTFRVWAPGAEEVVVNRYQSGTAGTNDLIEQISMTEDKNGTWVAEANGNLNGTYYTYTVMRNGNKTEDICDPYARTTGIDGARAMVIDLDSTDPAGWDSDSNPHEGEGITDAVIYEGHIRDLTVGGGSGVSEANRGKFLGLTETGTATSGGTATVVGHMKELGITHLHLLPVYDFGSVRETGEGDQYNWGYDPVNYNVPEGSYSTDPSKGEVRVKEFKQMVQSLHKNDISVIMDVVYNHVYDADKFCVNQIVPKYFSRFGADGKLYGDSECGNDTASERSMVSKYIVDSVCYWADEYHIDGFRFDLVGLLDIETINEIVRKVHEKHPSVIFYGEGWSMANEEVTGKYTMATQVNSTQTPGFAYFNDSIRDVLKGHVFDNTAPGYVSGKQGDEETVAKNFRGTADWCSSPSQTINYVSCHDNNTLFDRLALSKADASKEDLIRMNNLAAAVYITAEGVPFMQAGEEFLRSKIDSEGKFVENSYNAGDAVNAIQWNVLDETANAEAYEYYKGLIAFRKAHGAFRLSTAADVNKAVSVVEGLDKNVVAFDIKGSGIQGEIADQLFVIFNANPDAVSVTLPDGKWAVYINDKKAGTEVLGTITNKTATVAPISAMVLIRTSDDKNTTEKPVVDPTEKPVVNPEEKPVVDPTEEPEEEPVVDKKPTETVSSDPKVGKSIKDKKSNASYRVTKSGKGGTVEYKKPLSKKATVTIPDTIKISGKTYKVTSIAASAFKNNKKLTKVTIGKNVTNIGKNAFYGCKKLKEAVIGKSVTKIGKSAFYGCKKLNKIVIKSQKLKKKNVGAKAFKGTPTKAVVKVPKNKVKAYKTLLRSKGLSKKATVKK